MAEYQRRKAAGEITFNGVNWVERGEQPSLQDISDRFEEIKKKVPDVLREARRLFPNESIIDLTKRIESTLGGDKKKEGTEPLTEPLTEPTTPKPPAPSATTSQPERERTRREEIDKIKEELGGGLPDPFSALEEFDRLRQEKGIVADEQELSALRNEALQGKQELRVFSSQQKGLPEAGRLGAIDEAERNLSFRLEGLAIRERAILDRINTKNAYINTVLDLGEDDYDRNYKEYTDEFNRNLQATKLYNEQLDDEQQDALTAFTTIANLFQDKQISQIDPALSTQIDTLSAKLGIPAGTLQNALLTQGKEKILAPISVTNETGGKDIYFFTQGAVRSV
ncbi:MAG TPA: hypothetical protein ENI13_00585 [candidate division CPR3 bacterium]|uniref:Uncharacterized protein n=1 Tax=candidate division CPR3 bacterium TaxID=2268181 RepID=A0A7C1SR03_UNCC3|nr:hypothetical protein [candidate division CPR3 bacterium]